MVSSDVGWLTSNKRSSPLFEREFLLLRYLTASGVAQGHPSLAEAYLLPHDRGSEVLQMSRMTQMCCILIPRRVTI